jgi:hypothetical protein
MKFYIVGGKQRRTTGRMEEWHLYEEAVIAELDASTGRLGKVLEHVTPDDACPIDQNPGIIFKAATLDNDVLYACTQTEVMAYDVPSFRRRFYLSLPCFNDVHHVSPTPEGKLLVASTGLDLVVEVTTTGEILREWNVLGKDPWERFSRDIDYRQVLTTKPHESHPNYVFQIGSDIWVTRFEQRDAVCLTSEGRFAVEIEKPHDGIVRNGLVYFTTVDGHIIIFETQSRKLVRAVDLNQFCDLDEGTVMGWCRGLELLDENRLVVGFSRIRQTAFRQNLRWMRARALRKDVINALPTRIALMDIVEGKQLWAHDVESADVNAVFSVHALRR